LAKKIFEVLINLKNFILRRRRKGNPSAKRSFLKNFGSNFVLKDRNLIMERAYPYELVAKISPSEDWLRLCDDVRNYFKGPMVI